MEEEEGILVTKLGACCVPGALLLRTGDSVA
jgi:hypothetical protein